MVRQSGLQSKFFGVLTEGLLGAAALFVLLAVKVASPDLSDASSAALRSASGSPQLVAVAPLPAMNGEMCEWMPASAETTLIAALQQSSMPSGPKLAASVAIDREPVRVLRDTYPTYSAISQDPLTGEILIQDENLFGI